MAQLPVLDFFTLFDAGDKEAFAAHFHPEFYWLDHEGNVFDKNGYVNILMDTPMKMTHCEITNVVESIGQGAFAAATYTSLIGFEGQEGELKPCDELTIYKKHEGQWLLYHCRP